MYFKVFMMLLIIFAEALFLRINYVQENEPGYRNSSNYRVSCDRKVKTIRRATRPTVPYNKTYFQSFSYIDNAFMYRDGVESGLNTNPDLHDNAFLWKTDFVRSLKNYKENWRNHLYAAHDRLNLFLDPEVTEYEASVLSLEQHFGYAAQCDKNRLWVTVNAIYLGSGFNNKIIGLGNILYYTRAINATLVIHKDIQNELFQFYNPNVLERFFCVKFTKSKQLRRLPLHVTYRTVLHMFYYDRVSKYTNSSDFRFTLLKHLLLRPNEKVRRAAVSVLRSLKWNRFTTVHLRSYFQLYQFVRRSQRESCDRCRQAKHMPNEYVNSMMRKYGLSRTQVILMSDNINTTDTERLIRNGAVRVKLQDGEDKFLMHVEMIIAAVSTLFLGCPSSSMSTNIAIMQQAVKANHETLTGNSQLYANNIFPILVDTFK